MTFLCLNLVKEKQKEKKKKRCCPWVCCIHPNDWILQEKAVACTWGAEGLFFKKIFGDFWGLGNTILTMGLVYLIPICSFSPNQKKNPSNF